MSRLKELRKERGYTQVKMQMLTGIDQSDYSKIESGRRYFTSWINQNAHYIITGDLTVREMKEIVRSITE